MTDDRVHAPRRDDPEEQEERFDSYRVQHRTHFFISFLLILVIAGLAWYTYPMLKRHDASLKDLPSLSERLSGVTDQVKQAADRADQKFAQWTQAQDVDRQSLRAETAAATARVTTELRARIDAAGKQAHDSAEQMMQEVRSEINEKMDGVTTRVATLESSRDGDQKQIADLEQELSQMRGQVGQQASDLADVHRQMQESGTMAQERIASLRQDQDLTRHDVGVLQDKLAVEKVSFEASKGRTRELSDGISLNVSATDPNYRRASGWLWVASDHRNIWLRNLAAQEPLTFYGNQDGKKRELVLTNVSNTGVTGYLLLPKEPTEGRAEAAAGQ
ncbi:MAG TPA: hypothetical protein VGN17_29065 [Bryobacteraceae bacterium]|jgi:hypothetical protein